MTWHLCPNLSSIFVKNDVTLQLPNLGDVGTVLMAFPGQTFGNSPLGIFPQNSGRSDSKAESHQGGDFPQNWRFVFSRRVVGSTMKYQADVKRAQSNLCIVWVLCNFGRHLMLKKFLWTESEWIRTGVRSFRKLSVTILASLSLARIC